MKINDKWELVSDELNTILRRKVITKATDDKPISEYWLTEGYYVSPQSALRALIKKGIMGTGMEDLQSVCDKIDELHKMIDALPIGDPYAGHEEVD